MYVSSKNQFSGPIPDSHANVLKYNEIYNISYNNLTGTIPQGMVTSDKFHIYWFDILPQNPGYGFNDEVELPAHTNTVRCFDGSYLNLGEEYTKNKYTLLFRWDPYCPFSYEYPARMEQLRKKYEKEGLGIINMTLYNYSGKPQFFGKLGEKKDTITILIMYVNMISSLSSHIRPTSS